MGILSDDHGKSLKFLKFCNDRKSELRRRYEEEIGDTLATETEKRAGEAIVDAVICNIEIVEKEFLEIFQE